VDGYSLESRLPHGPLTGLTKAREHAHSERSNDASIILPTVSTWDSNFVILSALPNGELKLETWLDPEAVGDFYRERVLHRHHTLMQYCVNEFSTSWYQFTEQLGDLLWIETDQVVQVHVVGLFPAWVDGIIGEICWHAPEWMNEPFGAAQRVQLSRRLDEFDEAWRRGDVDSMLAMVGEPTSSVIRVVEFNGEARYRAIAGSKDELAAAWGAPELGRVIELERVHQCITNWYVFAAYNVVVEVGGRTLTRETARILPVGPNGEFLGELSYSMEAGV
jgi:hypothetical protein